VSESRSTLEIGSDLEGPDLPAATKSAPLCAARRQTTLKRAVPGQGLTVTGSITSLCEERYRPDGRKTRIGSRECQIMPAKE
jgi:hypothetical protein